MKTNKQSTMTLALMLAVSACFMPAQAEEVSHLEAAQAVPVAVSALHSGGYWTEGTKEGFYRVMATSAGTEHVKQQLMLQWLQLNAETQSYEIIQTIAVTEINELRPAMLQIETEFGDFNAHQVTVAIDRRGGDQESYDILAQGPGKYRIIKK